MSRPSKRNIAMATVLLLIGLLATSVTTEKTCLVTYDSETSQTSMVLDWVPEIGGLQGRPGKRGTKGPAGPKGSRGDAGARGPKGEAPSGLIASLEEKIQNLEDTISSLQEGWVTAGNQYKYLISHDLMTWNEANTFCENKGAKLATVGIRDSRVSKFLSGYILPGRSWVGLTDAAEESVWVWTDGTTSTTTNTFWGNGQPNSWEGNQDCAAFSEAGGIDDNACETKNLALCEKKPPFFV